MPSGNRKPQPSQASMITRNVLRIKIQSRIVSSAVAQDPPAPEAVPVPRESFQLHQPEPVEPIAPPAAEWQPLLEQASVESPAPFEAVELAPVQPEPPKPYEGLLEDAAILDVMYFGERLETYDAYFQAAQTFRNISKALEFMRLGNDGLLHRQFLEPPYTVLTQEFPKMPENIQAYNDGLDFANAALAPMDELD